MQNKFTDERLRCNSFQNYQAKFAATYSEPQTKQMAAQMSTIRHQ